MSQKEKVNSPEGMSNGGKRHLQPETENITIEDGSLVQKCQQGDNFAMERLILKYQNRVFNVIMKMCANADDAAELTQETFVKVIENIGSFKRQSELYTWIFRIAVNLTLNFCKRSVKLGFRSLDSTEDEKDEYARSSLKDILQDDKFPDPAKVAENKELCELIVKAMMKLDDAHRAIIVLRDIEGMNYEQISEVTGAELGTVKSRLSRARSNLREILEAAL